MKSNFKAQVDTFELIGKYHGNIRRVIKNQLDLTDCGELIRKNEKDKFEWNQRGLTIELCEDGYKQMTFIRIFVELPIVLDVLQHRPTELKPELVSQVENKILDVLQRIGILGLVPSVQWKMNIVQLSKDFYVEYDPHLLMKIIEYYVNIKDGRQSCKKERIQAKYSASKVNSIEFCDDGVYHTLSIIQKNVLSKEADATVGRFSQTPTHRVQYKIVCYRKELTCFEQQHADLRENCNLRSKFVSRYLTQLNKAALKILQDEAVAYFDSYSWGISDTVHERMKKFSERTGINFSQEVLSKIENYLIMVNTNDIAGVVDGLLSMGLSNAAALDAIFEKLALNSLVIPDDILEPQERKFFPYPSLELLLQDKVCEENL